MNTKEFVDKVKAIPFPCEIDIYNEWVGERRYIEIIAGFHKTFLMERIDRKLWTMGLREPVTLERALEIITNSLTKLREEIIVKGDHLFPLYEYLFKNHHIQITKERAKDIRMDPEELQSIRNRRSLS
jgi:hypothetical protein